MGGITDSLFEQIPDRNMRGTGMCISDDICVFRPSAYVVNVDTYLEDYHFTFPVSELPPIKIGKKDYHIGKGKMLAFEPDTTIKCTKDVPTGRYTAMSINRHFFMTTAREALKNKCDGFSEVGFVYDRSILNVIRSFEDEVELYENSCPLMLQSIGTLIVIQLLRCMGKQTDMGQRAVNANYIDTAKEYILTYYNANINIDDICKFINISPYHFIRMFREKTGVTPHAFLQSVRISKAEEMLKRGKHSIEEVARLNGYINTSHFSNHFKRMKGIRPSVYKKKYFI